MSELKQGFRLGIGGLIRSSIWISFVNIGLVSSYVWYHSEDDKLVCHLLLGQAIEYLRECGHGKSLEIWAQNWHSYHFYYIVVYAEG